MESKRDIQLQQEVVDPEMESLKYQLKLLETEVQIIDQTIARLIEHTQTTKNWAIGLWAGSIALALGQPDLRKYILLTALLPLLFWFIDAWWRHLQSQASFRATKISEFINDERLLDSFEQKKLMGFIVFDPTGRQYRDTEEYKKYTSIYRTIKFPEVRVFYLTLAIISLSLGIFFLCNP